MITGNKENIRQNTQLSMTFTKFGSFFRTSLDLIDIIELDKVELSY